MTKRVLYFLFLFALLLSMGAPAANASASLYEHYSLTSGPSVAAAQITAIYGNTLYFAAYGQTVTMDSGWMSAHTPEVGGYVVVPLSSASALSAASPNYSEADYSDGESFESGYALETNIHGGHEPIIIILD